MNSSMVNINIAEMAEAVEAFVRARATKLGSCIVYMDNGIVVKEDPRTGEKTAISPNTSIN